MLTSFSAQPKPGAQPKERAATSRTTPSKSRRQPAKPGNSTRPRTPEVASPEPLKNTHPEPAARNGREPPQLAREGPVEDDGQQPVDATTSPEPTRGKENGRAEVSLMYTCLRARTNTDSGRQYQRAWVRNLK